VRVPRHRLHIRLDVGDGLLRTGNLLGIVFQQVVLHAELLVLMVRPHDFQPCDLRVQLHALLDAGIARAQGLDLGVGQGRLVHVLAGAQRRPAGHDLADEFLLILQGLPQIGVECRFGDVTVDMHLLVHIAAATRAPSTLR
jgi:hypothetical protein